MKVKSYKNLLSELNKEKDVILTVSLWTYRSKRMVIRASFDEVKPYFDKDMFHNTFNKKMSFLALNGKRFCADPCTLKIVKIDSVEIYDKKVGVEEK